MFCNPHIFGVDGQNRVFYCFKRVASMAEKAIQKILGAGPEPSCDEHGVSFALRRVKWPLIIQWQFGWYHGACLRPICGVEAYFFVKDDFLWNGWDSMS